MTDDLPVRHREPERRRRVDQNIETLSHGGGPVGVSDDVVEIEVDDVTRIVIGLLSDGQVGIRFYDSNGAVQRTITGTGG